jgi:hypothetical protein
VLCSKRKQQQQRKHKSRGFGQQPKQPHHNTNSSSELDAWLVAFRNPFSGREVGMQQQVADTAARLIDSRVPDFHDEFRAALQKSGLECVDGFNIFWAVEAGVLAA